MQALPQAATLAVVILGLATLTVARFPIFRRDFRRSIAIAVGSVSLLTIILSLNVLLSAFTLQSSAPAEQVAMINGLMLAGFVLMLVSSLAFFFSLGVLIWTLVPTDGPQMRRGLRDRNVAPPPPRDPYTP